MLKSRPPERIPCPSVMRHDAAAQAEFRRLVAAAPAGHFIAIDAWSIALYCMRWSEWRMAERKLKELEGEKGELARQERRCWKIVSRDSLRHAKMWGDKLGLSKAILAGFKPVG